MEVFAIYTHCSDRVDGCYDSECNCSPIKYMATRELAEAECRRVAGDNWSDEYDVLPEKVLEAVEDYKEYKVWVNLKGQTVKEYATPLMHEGPEKATAWKDYYLTDTFCGYSTKGFEEATYAVVEFIENWKKEMAQAERAIKYRFVRA